MLIIAVGLRLEAVVVATRVDVDGNLDVQAGIGLSADGLLHRDQSLKSVCTWGLEI